MQRHFQKWCDFHHHSLGDLLVFLTIHCGQMRHIVTPDPIEIGSEYISSEAIVEM